MLGPPLPLPFPCVDSATPIAICGLVKNIQARHAAGHRKDWAVAKNTHTRTHVWPKRRKPEKLQRDQTKGERREGKYTQRQTQKRAMQAGSTPAADDVGGWLQRSLDCVTCDGRADTCALDVVQFAHDLAVARTIIASIRAERLSDDVVLSGIRVPHPHDARKLALFTVAESSPGSGEWRALAGMKPQTYGHVLGSDATPLNDDVVSALLALSARSRMAPFETVTSECDLVSSDARAWVVRMGHALALRSAPWDLSAVDQEIGLARRLIDVMVARRSKRARPTPVRLTGQGLCGPDASAYRAAIALWDQYGIALYNAGTPPPTRGDDPSYGLRVFVAAAERMQATPGFYLTFVAPAIAARLQPDLDALDKPIVEPEEPAPQRQ